MPVQQLNLDDFPNSPYAQALREGLGQLRFEAGLEAEYRAAHVQRVRLRVRIWHSLNVVLATLFSVAQVRRFGLWHAMPLMHVAVLVPCTVALVGLAWSGWYERYYLRAARVLVAVFGMLIAIFVAVALAEGQVEQLASLAVILVSLFFFAGLLFRQALVTAAIMLAAFAATGLVVGLAPALLLKSMVILSLTSVMAALVHWDVEKAYRSGFLEDALIGELVARDGLSGLMNRRAFDEHCCGCGSMPCGMAGPSRCS